MAEKEHCKSLLQSTKAVYGAIGKVYCPILEENVTFNAKGFHHFRYKPGGTARNLKDVIQRLTLFPLVVPAIKNAVAIDDEREITITQKGKKKKVKTYAIVAIVGRKNPVAVRVIILRVGDGKHIFWSVMRN